MNFKKKLEKCQRYAAAPGSHITDKQAEIIGSELCRMQTQGLAVTPDAVVDRARSASNPLNPFFDWDDTVAASKWRREQAGHLVRSLELVVVAPEGEQRVKAQWSVSVIGSEEPDGPLEREYVSVRQARQDEVYREQVLRGAIQEFNSWIKKYEAFGLDELRPVFEAATRLRK